MFYYDVVCFSTICMKCMYERSTGFAVVGVNGLETLYSRLTLSYDLLLPIFTNYSLNNFI